MSGYNRGGSFRGRGGGRSFRGGGRGGRGGGFGFDQGPPDTVVELGQVSHTCHDDLVVKVSQTDVPYFNAPIYLENKQQIGKIDEIFGNVRDYMVSVKLSDDVKAKSFAVSQKCYIDPNRLLTLARFLSAPQRRSGGRRGMAGGRGMRGRGGRPSTPRGGGGRSFRGGSGGSSFRRPAGRGGLRSAFRGGYRRG